jgi:hypothetical protein
MRASGHSTTSSGLESHTRPDTNQGLSGLFTQES